MSAILVPFPFRFVNKQLKITAPIVRGMKGMGKCVIPSCGGVSVCHGGGFSYNQIFPKIRVLHHTTNLEAENADFR
jgi:hypothetical protein